MFGGFWILCCVVSFYSCQKQNYEDGFVTFGNVYFQNQSVLNTDLSIKYKGEPIAWQGGTGMVKVPEGEASFEFYNKRTGKVLGEKTVQVIASHPETFLVFQPTIDAPVAFLDPNEQADEEAAPEGFYKMKLANYSFDLLPFEKIDIIVMGEKFNLETFELSYEELAMLEDVGRNLGDESYRLIPKPTGGDFTGSILFAFRDSNTGMDVLNHGGRLYISSFAFFPEFEYPNAQKAVFTVYLIPYEQWGESEEHLAYGGTYYDIEPKVLFSD